MLTYLSISLSLLCITGMVVLYFRFRQREKRSIESLSSKISGLLSEFNSVTSSKIELLDDRSEEVEKILERAQRTADKLRSLIKEAEDARRIIEDATGSSDQDDDGLVREEVIELAEKGYSTSQIAEETGLKPGEVSVIVRLNQSEVLNS